MWVSFIRSKWDYLEFLQTSKHNRRLRWPEVTSSPSSSQGWPFIWGNWSPPISSCVKWVLYWAHLTRFFSRLSEVICMDFLAQNIVIVLQIFCGKRRGENRACLCMWCVFGRHAHRSCSLWLDGFGEDRILKQAWHVTVVFYLKWVKLRHLRRLWTNCLETKKKLSFLSTQLPQVWTKLAV